MRRLRYGANIWKKVIFFNLYISYRNTVSSRSWWSKCFILIYSNYFLSSLRSFFGYSLWLTNLWANFPSYSWTAQLTLNVDQREPNREIIFSFLCCGSIILHLERKGQLWWSLCLLNRKLATVESFKADVSSVSPSSFALTKG